MKHAAHLVLSFLPHALSFSLLCICNNSEQRGWQMFWTHARSSRLFFSERAKSLHTASPESLRVRLCWSFILTSSRVQRRSERGSRNANAFLKTAPQHDVDSKTVGTGAEMQLSHQENAALGIYAPRSWSQRQRVPALFGLYDWYKIKS